MHNGGCVNDSYLGNAKKLGFVPHAKAKLGVVLVPSEQYIRNTIDNCYELSVRVTQGVVRRLYSDSFEDADRALNNPTVDLLVEERWELAQRVFKYALGIPEKLRSDSEYYYYWLINYCIALKFGGKPFQENLEKVHWTAFHPKYHFAVSVLEERFGDAASLMQTEAVRGSISREEFLSWPLLRDFRKSDVFLDAFGRIVGQQEQDEVLRQVESELRAEQSVGRDAAEDAKSDG